MCCPLCKSDLKATEETIRVDLLKRGYQKLIDKIDKSLLSDQIGLITCANCDFRYFKGGIPGDELFYTELNNYSWYYQKVKKEYEYVAQLVEEGYSVLDVGCGEGDFCDYVENASGKFVGLELNSKAVRVGMQKGREISTKSISKIVEEKGHFDIVTSFQVCEHVKDINTFIELKISALKKNGILVIAVPSENSFISKSVNAILNYPPHHMSRWSDLTLKNLPKIFNLDLIDIYHEPVAANHLKWFWRVKMENYFLKFRHLDNSFLRRIVSTLSRIMVNVLFVPLFKGRPTNSNGHTVIAYYRKR